MAVRDINQGELGWINVTLIRVSQGGYTRVRLEVLDIDHGESGWLYVTLTRVSQGGST